MATGFLSLFSYGAAPPPTAVHPTAQAQQNASTSGMVSGSTPVLSSERPPPPKRARTTTGATVAAAPVAVAAAAAVVPTLGENLGGTYATAMDRSAKLARREKNREHARRSRMRKLEQQETLEAQALELREENARLRALVKSKLPDKAAGIIGACCYRQPLPDVFHGGAAAAEEEGGEAASASASASPGGAAPQQSDLLSTDFDLIERLTSSNQSFILTDPRLPDNPIVYASEAFLELTGYGRDRVLGRNARFLQGPETDGRAVSKVREAVKGGRDVTSCLLNYKADGTTFWNQFWVAALRDRRGRIMNYVGVQCAVDPPDQSELDLKPAAVPQQVADTAGPPAADPNVSLNPVAAIAEQALPLAVTDSTMFQKSGRNPVDSDFLQDDLESIYYDPGDVDDGVGELDWAVLAETLEADYKDGGDNIDDGLGPSADADEGADETDHASEKDETPHPTATAVQTTLGPTRAFVTKTVRSELIDCLVSSHGDVTLPRFISVLDILASIYAATPHCNSSFSDVLHGSWRSLSRPSYQGCLGMNDRGNFVYALGKMSFNMFQPGNLRCSVQQTLNDIKPVCKMDGAPAAAPWSLRRELALRDQDDPHAATEAQPNTMLKSYDIAVALTIEPGQFKAKPKECIPSPASRLRALKVVQGYFLPDPDTPNRLTVWFTGGKLTPVPQNDNIVEGDSEYGGFEEWKNLFGKTHKRTWGESFSVMGAKLFLGAEMSDGMDKDGTLRYTLRRPHGGHGKAYVDVLYLDEEVLITRGNAGTIHVMTRNSSANVADPLLTTGIVPLETTHPANLETAVENAPSVPARPTAFKGGQRGEKRKMGDTDLDNTNTTSIVREGNDGGSSTADQTELATSSGHGDSFVSNAGRKEEPSSKEATSANRPFYNLPPVIQSNESQPMNDGVTNIMQSVEAFYGSGMLF